MTQYKTKSTGTYMWRQGKHAPFPSAMFQLPSRALDERASNLDPFCVICLVLQSDAGPSDSFECNSDELRATGTAKGHATISLTPVFLGTL